MNPGYDEAAGACGVPLRPPESTTAGLQAPPNAKPPFFVVFDVSPPTFPPLTRSTCLPKKHVTSRNQKAYRNPRGTAATQSAQGLCWEEKLAFAEVQ